MLFRSVAVALVLPLIFGCAPERQAQVDEQRNPYFLEGKARLGTRDYKGAIAAFEKALEVNPRSALAHFELGVLYEQHSDQREDDYVAALYHYNQVVRLRPHTYPADNARQRIASCKQELVRSQSMAPVYQQTIRELDRLKDENQHLRRQLEVLHAQAASRFVAPASLAGNASVATGEGRAAIETSAVETPIVVASNPAGGSARSTATGESRAADTRPSGNQKTARIHTVRAGDTPYSIARSYRVRVEALLAANPKLEAHRMKVGQTIAIPPP